MDSTAPQCGRLAKLLWADLWKNGGSDPDAIWHRRSDGFRDEAGSGVWGSVHGKGNFWEQICGTPLSTGTYWVYVCYSAAMRPSCQITLGRLVTHHHHRSGSESYGTGTGPGVEATGAGLTTAGREQE